METPKFSIVMIAKNEAKTLPKCIESLKEFQERGGEIILCDTGSTDGTPELARSLGCKVTEVGDKFITTLDEDFAECLNERFVMEGETNIVNAGNRLFDFAAARNYATSLATNDMVCTLDADEAYSVLNIDILNQLISDGWEQFEYQFVYAHDWMGNPAVQFVQSKFFDRRKVRWEGVVHEVLQGEAKHMLLGPEVIYLEHWQLPGGEHRGNYLVGLAVDCFNNPDKDRQSHYLARELMWTAHPKSALKEFERHIAMKDRWPAERAQSIIFMGDCYGMLNDPAKQASMYVQAFIADPNRREAPIKLARFYLHNKQYQQVVVWAKAALEIPWTDYYANDKAMYEEEPHYLLYTAYGWLGRIADAQKEIMICLDYQRENPRFMHDTKYYFEYPANFVAGWFSFKEQQFIYNTAKKMESMIELGSWKGKSTHAACSSGCPRVVAIDTWKGSEFEPQAHAEARSGAVYDEFIKNVGHFDNLTIIKNDINLVVDSIPDKSVDMVFIDASHEYKDVCNDITKWKPKAKLILCGHDYTVGWAGVRQAVDELLGGPDEVFDSVWVKYLV